MYRLLVTLSPIFRVIRALNRQLNPARTLAEPCQNPVEPCQNPAEPCQILPEPRPNPARTLAEKIASPWKITIFILQIETLQKLYKIETNGFLQNDQQYIGNSSQLSYVQFIGSKYFKNSKNDYFFHFLNIL